MYVPSKMPVTPTYLLSVMTHELQAPRKLLFHNGIRRMKLSLALE